MDAGNSGTKGNAEPFFAIVREGLGNAVDGSDSWDAVAADAVFEFRYIFPGQPERIEGRDAYRDWFRNYSAILRSADGLRVYRCVEPADVLVLEYEVHGVMPRTGKAYDNRFCSIVTIRNRKVVLWRDYTDALAVLQASTPDDERTLS